MPARFFSLDQVRAGQEERNFHFFDDGAMRFFNSRIESPLMDGRFFITSEQYDEESPRLFTVRVVGEDYRISTVGAFQEHDSYQDAFSVLYGLVKEGA